MQSPSRGALNIDHIAHFVPQREPCHEALTRMGFRPTPFSLQRHRATPDAPLTPAGTGNHCVMLSRGYLEFLVPVGDTDVAAQLRGSIQRHVGVHSIVFGTADPQADHERLRREGFDPLPPIDLQRPIGTPEGEQIARFTVVRVPAGTMAEGRIQFCRHHTEALVWQSRWLEHDNGAVALSGVIVCASDVDEAAERYARFTGLAVKRIGAGVRVLATERGWVRFHDPLSLESDLEARSCHTGVVVGCELLTRDLAATRHFLEARALAVRSLDASRVAVSAPPAIGGEFVFAAA